MDKHSINSEFDIVAQYLIDDDIISVEYNGTFPKNKDEIDSVYKYFNKLKQKDKCKRFIVDFRNVTYLPSVNDMLASAERLKAFEIDDTTMKFVVTPNSETHKNLNLVKADVDTKKFLGKNKLNANIFNDFDSALSSFKKTVD
jgi:hypothetical protein